MSATTNLDGDAIVMAENPRPLEQMLDLTEEEPSAEHLDNQVQKRRSNSSNSSASRSRSRSKNANWKS